MKSCLKFIFPLMLSLTALQTSAQTVVPTDQNYYIEFGLTPLHVRSEAGDVSHPQAARLAFGKNVHPNWALEGFYLTTYTKDSRPGFDATATHYGLALKPKVAMTDSTELFARLGWSHANMTVATDGSRTGTDFTYGWGIQTAFTKSVYGQLDYMTYYDKEGTSAKGFTLAIGTRF